MPDDRIGALVLLAPACGWFNYDGALADVDVPILVITAEKDELAPFLHADLVKRTVRDPGKVQTREVANAGHHSFQSPFPPSMTRPNFPPSQDPHGFDRVAFQPILNAEILSFLQSVYSS
jgi:predicted dienelactone hydrolase